MNTMPPIQAAEGDVEYILRLIEYANDPTLSSFARLEAMDAALQSIGKQLESLNKKPKEDLVAFIQSLIPQIVKQSTPSSKYLQSLIQPLITPAKDGKTPTREELLALIAPLIPKVESGKTPVLGVDYFVPSEESIAREVAARYITTEWIFKALFDIPDNVISAINGGTAQIKPSRIEGLDKLMDEVRKKHWPPFWAGSGGSQSSSSGATKIANNKLVPTQSGTSITLDLTGLSHTFSNVLSVKKNGQELDKDDVAFGWSISGSTLTVLNGADTDIFYVLYTYA